MEALPCLIFPAFLAIAAAAIVIGIVMGRKRREEMRALAAELGFQFHENDPWGLPTRYERFDLFGHGHSKRASNILHGQVDGTNVVLFDYRYKTGSGKNESTHHYHAAVFSMPIVSPSLRMRGENIFDRVASWVGHDDIDFESDEFSRRYHVKCTDRRFAYDFFHARLIEYLLSCGQVPNLETGGTLLLVNQSGSGKPDQFRRLLTVGRGILQSIPDYVLKDRGTGQLPGGEP